MKIVLIFAWETGKTTTISIRSPNSSGRCVSGAVTRLNLVLGPDHQRGALDSYFVRIYVPLLLGVTPETSFQTFSSNRGASLAQRDAEIHGDTLLLAIALVVGV